MNHIDYNNIRNEFETWTMTQVTALMPGVNPLQRSDDGESYVWSIVATQWDSWKAAYAAGRNAGMKEAAEIADKLVSGNPGIAAYMACGEAAKAIREATN